jgi:hypothetical protein
MAPAHRMPRAARASAPSDPRPKASIRRFDVFAEYNRLEAIERGMARDGAKGHGLWMAKVVAARKFGRLSGREKGEPGGGEKPRGKWHTLGDEAQTDERFDREIVERMGRTFYRTVFAPTLREAFRDGRSYVAIRDSIRASWKP